MGDEEFINDSLQAGEDAEARRQAEEDALDANGLNESLDVDPQNEPYDSSAQFTNYNGGDAFDMTGNHEANEVGTNDGEDDDEANEADNDFDGDDGDFDNDAEDFDGDEEDNDDDDDSDEDEEDDDDEENDDGDDDTDVNRNKRNRLKNKGGRLIGAVNNSKPMQRLTKPLYQSSDKAANKWKDEDYDGYIKWKPGDPITVLFLSKTWNEIHTLTPLRSLIRTANKVVMEALEATCSPMLTFRIIHFFRKLRDINADKISTLLDIAVNNGEKMLAICGSSVEAFFIQNWIQAGVFAGLATALNTAMALEPVKGVLNRLLTDAVPMINRMHNVRKIVNNIIDLEDSITGEERVQVGLEDQFRQDEINSGSSVA